VVENGITRSANKMNAGFVRLLIVVQGYQTYSFKIQIVGDY